MCRICSRIPLSNMVFIWFYSSFKNTKCSMSSERISGISSLSKFSRVFSINYSNVSFCLSLGRVLAFTFFFLNV